MCVQQLDYHGVLRSFCSRPPGRIEVKMYVVVNKVFKSKSKSESKEEMEPITI